MSNASSRLRHCGGRVPHLYMLGAHGPVGADGLLPWMASMYAEHGAQVYGAGKSPALAYEDLQRRRLNSELRAETDRQAAEKRLEQRRSEEQRIRQATLQDAEPTRSYVRQD